MISEIPANPEVEKSWAGFANVSFLYWWTAEEGLAYAVGNTTVKNPKMKSDIGFKVGIGALLPHDGWDLFFQITHLHSRAKVLAQQTMVPQWTLPQTTSGFVEAARGHWRLHFAFLDLELGRKFFWSPFFTTRLHMGGRYVIARQKYLIHYIGGTLFPGGESYVSMKNKYLAPGIRTGVNLEWNFFCGWSLYSDWALSLMYGPLYVHQAEQVSYEEEKRYNLFNCFHSGKSILDFALGLQWETFFHRRGLHFLIQAGFEEHLLFSQNRFFHFPAQSANAFDSASGNLGLQGFVLNGKLTY